jgi:hypothetical protein
MSSANPFSIEQGPVKSTSPALSRRRKRSHSGEEATGNEAGKETDQEKDEVPGNVTMFQCRGFGDCQMVFTRSEHLARHVR